MIRGMATLLGFQLIGELSARFGHLPIPGPICGMALLLCWLHLTGAAESNLEKACDGILANMAILFVPLGVGIMNYAGLFAGVWPVVVLAIVAGAVATLLTTAFVTRTLTAWIARRGVRIDDQGRQSARQ